MSASVITGPWLEKPDARVRRQFAISVKLTSGRTVEFQHSCRSSFDAYDEALSRYEHSADRIEVTPLAQEARHAQA